MKVPADGQDSVRAGGYVRVSTDEQAREGISLDDQDRRIRERIAERGWECVDVFVDRGVSGSVPFAERPAGGQALAAGLDVLVVVTWDRLSRDAADFLTVVRDLNVESIIEDGEPPLLRDLRAVLAQEERRKIAERAKGTAYALAREGRYNGPPLCGYRFVDRRLEPLSEEVPIVERVFQEFVSGRLRKPIAAGLDFDGIPTKRGGKWTPASVTTMLKHPVYIGKVRDPDGELFDGQHEAIIDEDLWNQVQVMLAAQAKPRGKGRGRPPKLDYLLWGLLKCGECGAAMVPRTATGRNGKKSTEWYTCNSYLQFGADSPCSMRSLRRVEVDEAVWRHFEEAGLDKEGTLADLRKAHQRQLDDVRTQRERAEQDALKAQAQLTRIRGDYMDEKLTADEWREFKDELESKRQGAEAEAERLRASEAEVERDGVLLDASDELQKHLADLRRAVAGKVTSTKSMQAARATLMQMFREFVLTIAGGEPVIRPKLRARIDFDLTDVSPDPEADNAGKGKFELHVTKSAVLRMGKPETKTAKARPSS